MNKALVSLTFDDGLRCQFERALPILDRHGVLATFFVVANTDPIHTDGCPHPDWRKVNWSESDIDYLKDISRRGHEIGAHSISHRRPELDNNPKLEAEGSKEWIESRLDIEVDSYCYPFCHITPQIRSAVMKAGYKQARGGATSAFIRSSNTDLWNLDCRLITPHENVQSWVRPDCWHILMYHGIGTIQDGWEPIPITEFNRQIEELAQLSNSGSVEVLPFNQGAERVRSSFPR